MHAGGLCSWFSCPAEDGNLCSWFAESIRWILLHTFSASIDPVMRFSFFNRWCWTVLLADLGMWSQLRVYSKSQLFVVYNPSCTLLTFPWELLRFIFMKQSVVLPLSSVSVWFQDSSSAGLPGKVSFPGKFVENAVVSLSKTHLDLALFFEKI